MHHACALGKLELPKGSNIKEGGVLHARINPSVVFIAPLFR